MDTDTEIATYRANPRLAPALMRRGLAARVVGVSTRSLQRWEAHGYIKTSKPGGGMVLIHRDSLLDFLERSASK